VVYEVGCVEGKLEGVVEWFVVGLKDGDVEGEEEGK